jgi:lipoprotein-releasing system permease protein
MNAAGFIARKLRFSETIAMVSIAISFLIMIIAVAISSGFRHSIRDGIAFVAGDIQLTPSDMNYYGQSVPVPVRPSYYSKLDSIPGVKSINPVIYRAGIVKNGEEINGVLFKGLPDDKELLETVGLPLDSKSSSPLAISIPRKLAYILSLKEGDGLPAYFIGESVKVRKFRIEKIYKDILNIGDDMIVYAHLSDMQRLNGWDNKEASALEIMLKGKYRNEYTIRQVSNDAGSIALMYAKDNEPPLVASSALSRYPQIFDWLRLIDSNVYFILVLMTIVAAFNMISGLLIFLFRNISTIGTLKTLGMTDRHISMVFLKVASRLVLKGMVIGNGIALLLCSIQGFFHLIRLNPENYSVSYIPIHISPFLIAGADVLSYLVIMVLLLIPSLFISRVDPADTVRMN